MGKSIGKKRVSISEKGETKTRPPKGAKNVMTRVLKDAIPLAAAESKHAGGRGLVGYLKHISKKGPTYSSAFWKI